MERIIAQRKEMMRASSLPVPIPQPSSSALTISTSTNGGGGGTPKHRPKQDSVEELSRIVSDWRLHDSPSPDVGPYGYNGRHVPHAKMFESQVPGDYDARVYLGGSPELAHHASSSLSGTGWSSATSSPVPGSSMGTHPSSPYMQSSSAQPHGGALRKPQSPGNLLFTSKMPVPISNFSLYHPQPQLTQGAHPVAATYAQHLVREQQQQLHHQHLHHQHLHNQQQQHHNHNHQHQQHTSVPSAQSPTVFVEDADGVVEAMDYAPGESELETVARHLEIGSRQGSAFHAASSSRITPGSFVPSSSTSNSPSASMEAMHHASVRGDEGEDAGDAPAATAAAISTATTTTTMTMPGEA